MAKKHNDNPDQIDLTSFAFVGAGDPKDGLPGCGGCHPGRRRHGVGPGRQALRPAPQGGTQLAQTLDGDYFKSKWDKTGVVEADCFICHLPGYNFKERNKQLKKLNYKWATVAASGIGQVTGFGQGRPATHRGL